VNIGNVLVLVAVITLLIAAAGVVGGQYRISRNKVAIDITKEIAEAWEAKARQQETQIADLEREAQVTKTETTAALAAKDAEIAAVKARLEVLQDMVTGRSAIDELKADHHLLQVKVAETLAQVGAARTDIRELAAAVEGKAA
jgi:Tfp pilus assembly protein PilX